MLSLRLKLTACCRAKFSALLGRTPAVARLVVLPLLPDTNEHSISYRCGNFSLFARMVISPWPRPRYAARWRRVACPDRRLSKKNDRLLSADEESVSRGLEITERSRSGLSGEDSRRVLAPIRKRKSACWDRFSSEASHMRWPFWKPMPPLVALWLLRRLVAPASIRRAF